MGNAEFLDRQWSDVLALLPADLEESVREFGALRRRRQLRSGADVLRLALWYGVGGLSLREISAQADLIEMAEISDVSVMERLMKTSRWLEHILQQLLAARNEASAEDGMPVHLVDATTIEEPGGRSGERLWRLHVRLDLDRDELMHAELTDHRSGESFLRHEVEPGSLLVGDRVYGTRKGVSHVLDEGGHVLVRITPKSFPLEDRHGRRVDLISEVGSKLAPGEVANRSLWYRAGGASRPIRIIMQRKEAESAAYGRRRARDKARKGQYVVSEATLDASEYLVLATDLPTKRFTALRLLRLYRLRWRVETYFKRLKSVSGLADLRAHKPELVRTFIYANLIGAVLVDGLLDRALSFPPGEADFWLVGFPEEGDEYADPGSAGLSADLRADNAVAPGRSPAQRAQPATPTKAAQARQSTSYGTSAPLLT